MQRLRRPQPDPGRARDDAGGIAVTSGHDRIQGMLETLTGPLSHDQPDPPEICERPDAWLCELTIQEAATEHASTTALEAASLRKSRHHKPGHRDRRLGSGYEVNRSVEPGPVSGVGDKASLRVACT